MTADLQPEQPRLPASIRLAALLGFELFLVVALHQLGRYAWMRIDWSDVGRWATDSPAEDVLVSILRTGTLALAWWLLVSTLAYIVTAEAGAPRALRSVQWALLPGVRRIVDGVVALSITSGPVLARPAAADQSVEAPAVPDAATASQSRSLPAETVGFRLAIYPYNEPLPPAAPAAPSYTVRTGDSLWQIAEDRLGDGERWTEIWELNHDRIVAAGSNDPHLIHIGWVLVLPAAAPTPTPAANGADGANGGVPTYTVAPGDSMWSIAEDQLASLWGRQPSTDEVRGHWSELLALNDAQLASSGDPNRIYAGQQLLLAPVPPDPVAPQLPPPRPPVTEPTIPPPEAQPPTPPTTQITTPTTAPTTTTSTDLSTTPSSDERSVSRAPQGGDDASPAPLLAEIAGLTMLATGVLLRLRLLRRRRRAAQGVQRGSLPAPLERGLAATADLPLARWAGQELARLAQRLDPGRLGEAAPVVLELSEDAGIEMLWNQPMPDAPAPWEAIDHGWSWKLPYDPETPVPPDELPAPVPALVTVGDRNGRQLLIDLEAYGSIALAGDTTRVVEFATALALELGAGEELANAYVYTVGHEAPGTAQLDRVATVDQKSARRRLRSVSTEVEEALTSTGMSTSFALRCGADAPGLESAVVFSLAGDPQVNDEFIEHSPPRRGVATVMLGVTPAAAGAQITLKPDGAARIDPLGIEFRATGVSESLAEAVDTLLTTESGDAETDTSAGEADDLTVEAHETEPPRPFVAEDSGQDAVELVAADGDRSEARQTRFFDPARLQVAAHDGEMVDVDDRLLVRVLGPPQIPDRPGLGRRELEVVVLLACKEKPVHPSTVLNAIWGGKQVQGKTLWNLMARARKALSTFDDGEEVFPSADRIHNSLRLSDRVITDLALLRSLYEHALHESSTTAIGLLEQGLSLVEGEPFDAPGYDWAHHQYQYVQEAAGLIEDAATQLVELATAAGDTATARDAILRGLRGLPGNEALYRTRMELEHSTGNTAAVHAAWDELTEFLLDLDSEPSEATRTLYEQLTGGGGPDRRDPPTQDPTR